MLLNLSSAIERLFERNNSCLKQVVQAEPEALTTQTQAEAKLPLEPPTALTPTEMAREAKRQQRKARYEEVLALAKKGATKTAIAQTLALDPVTVRRYLEAPEFPEIRRPLRRGGSKLKPYQAYLRERWSQGQVSVKELLSEIRDQGYHGGSTIVYDYLQSLKEPSEWMEEYKRQHKQQHQTKKIKAPLLSARQAAWLYVSNPRKLKLKQVQTLEKLRQYDDHKNLAYQLAQDFRVMVTQRRVRMLGTWLSETKASGIAELESLARGVERDLAAVRASLELEWSNGPTEGFVNKTKLVKRQMYGRAKFDLLRARMLGPLEPKGVLSSQPGLEAKPFLQAAA